MTASATVSSNLRLKAVNQRRTRLFGSSSLKLFSTTPADGETLEAELTKDWFAHRVLELTGVGSKTPDAGAWQFKIAAPADWKTSQSFMKSIVIVTVGDERWKITKREKPIGQSLMWKLKAQMQ